MSFSQLHASLTTILSWQDGGSISHVAASLILLFLCSTAGAQVTASTACGNPFVNHFGPFDYRTANSADKQIVENVHFTPGIEAMVRPGTTTQTMMAADVAYTLHVFPNHHRALITMMRLGEKHKSPQPPGAKFTVECYFDRAVRFRPDDTIARALYAQYLVKNNRKPQAIQQLDFAVVQAKDNALSHYNIGLVYLEMAEFEKALAQAHRAKELGLEREKLEAELRKAGRWRDPEN